MRSGQTLRQYAPVLGVDAHPNHVSAACWDGKHHRCDGWLVIDGVYQGGLSLTCECPICWHPPVARDRHLHEEVQRGVRWSSSTTIP